MKRGLERNRDVCQSLRRVGSNDFGQPWSRGFAALNKVGQRIPRQGRMMVGVDCGMESRKRLPSVDSRLPGRGVVFQGQIPIERQAWIRKAEVEAPGCADERAVLDLHAFRAGSFLSELIEPGKVFCLVKEARRDIVPGFPHLIPQCGV